MCYARGRLPGDSGPLINQSERAYYRSHKIRGFTRNRNEYHEGGVVAKFLNCVMKIKIKSKDQDKATPYSTFILWKHFFTLVVSRCTLSTLAKFILALVIREEVELFLHFIVQCE